MEGMFVLNLDKLRKGDIILDRDDTKTSAKIRRLSKSQYSHARLYADKTILESEGVGVQSVNPQRLLYFNDDDAVVLRAKSITDQQISCIIDYARTIVPTEYSREDVRRSMVKPSEMDEPNRQFCTRFVAQSFAAGGISIVGDPNFCTAEEILTSEALAIIPNCLREANDDDLSMIDSPGLLKQESETNNQALIIGSLYEKFRMIAGTDIQTEEDVINYLLSNPSKDYEFASALKESDYYTMWKQYEDDNPWEFDPNIMDEHHGKYSLQASIDYLEALQEPRARFNHMHSVYKSLAEQFGLDFFNAMYVMYSNILESCQRKEDAAKTVFMRNRLGINCPFNY